jgi:hypothetical protein
MTIKKDKTGEFVVFYETFGFSTLKAWLYGMQVLMEQTSFVHAFALEKGGYLFCFK